MVPFLLTGGVLGFIIGAVIAYLGPGSANASQSQEMLALAIPLGVLGALLSAIVYLLVERASDRPKSGR